MATSDFLPLAVGVGANVETQAAYAAETALLANGFQAGVAPSAKFNKALRQATIMAAVLAKFIVDESGQNSIDDGTTATLIANLKAGVNAMIAAGSAGLRASSATSISSSTILTSANLGSSIYLGGASPQTITLPAVSACPSGTRLEFLCISTATWTINRAGSDVIYPNGASITSVPLNPGDTVTLESNGSSWLMVGGTAQLLYSTLFGGSIAASGWRRLPSGDIEQWGTVTLTAGQTSTITLPITFPNAILHVMAGINGTNSAGAGVDVAYASPVSTSQISISHDFYSVSANLTVAWRAIGK
jgi:hypothetical protein